MPGGIETHCRELYPLIVEKGYRVTVAGRKPYLTSGQTRWKGVDILPVWTVSGQYGETIVHTFLSILKTWSMKADLVHIHAVGPALLAPLAKLLGLTVVFTSHGPDYRKNKWGRLARVVLRCGEYAGVTFSDQVIAISNSIHDQILAAYKRKSRVIHNGVHLPRRSVQTGFLNSIGVRPGRYVLAVARFVPEKGLDLLMDAFRRVEHKGIKLVFAGDADHGTGYSRQLNQAIARDPDIVGTGYITGEKLNQVYSHAGLFVLPSFHEGLPIALLEAMSYGLPVLVSDIPANLEVGLARERYFTCGDVNDLKEKIQYHLDKPMDMAETSRYQTWIQQKYNWKSIAEQTVKVYENALAG